LCSSFPFPPSQQNETPNPTSHTRHEALNPTS
jgi:hypothetical protein